MNLIDYDIRTGKRIKRRKPFKTSTKKEALKRAGYKCQNPRCRINLRRSPHKKLGYVVEFDHWDNNPSNNSAKNCKVLCPTCHSQLTVLKKRKVRNLVGYGYKTIKKHSGVKRKKKKRGDAGKNRPKKPRGLLDGGWFKNF